MPRISVIAALFNHEKYVAKAIESVISQTFTDWELILWDDGSSDRSLEIAKSYAAKDPERIFVHKHEFGANRGQENTRNAAIAKARGEFLSLLDTDDYFHPEKLKSLFAVLNSDISVGLAFGRVEVVSDQGGRSVKTLAASEMSGEVFDELVLDNFISACAVLFRKKFVEEGMKFDSRFKTIGEYPLWLEIARNSKVAFVPQVVAYWRVHDSNTGSKLAVQAKRELVDLKEWMLSEKKYDRFTSAIRRGLAKSRYDYISELYRVLDLHEMRVQCLKLVIDSYATTAQRAKAAALLASSGAGKKVNKLLSSLKQKAYEVRNPLAKYTKKN